LTNDSSTMRKACSRAVSCTTNATWIGLESSPGLSDETPSPNLLEHVTAYFCDISDAVSRYGYTASMMHDYEVLV
jgi:hypothetical protein